MLCCKRIRFPWNRMGKMPMTDQLFDLLHNDLTAGEKPEHGDQEEQGAGDAEYHRLKFIAQMGGRSKQG